MVSPAPGRDLSCPPDATGGRVSQSCRWKTSNEFESSNTTQARFVCSEAKLTFAYAPGRKLDPKRTFQRTWSHRLSTCSQFFYGVGCQRLGTSAPLAAVDVKNLHHRAVASFQRQSERPVIP